MNKWNIPQLMNWWMLVQLYNEILLNNKKEQGIGTFYNMHEFLIYYVKWKKSDSKCHILDDSFYMTYWERQNYKDGKQRSGFQEERFKELFDYKGFMNVVLEWLNCLLYKLWWCLCDSMYWSKHRKIHQKVLVLLYVN